MKEKTSQITALPLQQTSEGEKKSKVDVYRCLQVLSETGLLLTVIPNTCYQKVREKLDL